MVYRKQDIRIDENLSEEEYKREYYRVWRKQNKEYVREYNKSRYHREIDRVRRNKRNYIEYMGSECILCGLQFNGLNAAVFDFHHTDPTKKEFNFGGKNRCLNSMKEELDKCVLVCANCHRLLHAGVLQLEGISSQTHTDAL